MRSKLVICLYAITCIITMIANTNKWKGNTFKCDRDEDVFISNNGYYSMFEERMNRPH